MDWPHPVQATTKHSQTSTRQESTRHQAKRKANQPMARWTLDIELRKTKMSWGEVKIQAYTEPNGMLWWKPYDPLGVKRIK